MVVVELVPLTGRVQAEDIKLDSRVKLPGGRWSPWEPQDGIPTGDTVDWHAQRMLALRGILSGVRPEEITIKMPNGGKLQFRERKD